MSDVLEQAKQARALLAKALSLLQGDGATPPLRASAELVARGMGLLHQMERQPAQASRTTEQVLPVIRDALSSLQLTAKSHPAAQRAIESVAAALGIVHGLNHQGARPAAAKRGARPQMGVKTLNLLQPEAKPAVAHKAGDAADEAPASAGLPPLAPALVAKTSEGSSNGKPVAEGQAAAEHTAANASNTAAPGDAAAEAWPVSLRRRPTVKKRLPRQYDDGPFTIEASLGAHSSSNFYKGLGGEGVLEAGGIFVATYRIPPIGKPVTLHVRLPGGYEFQARAVVAWTRETSTTVSEGLDAPPGFGARFTEISPQGRELVDRYAANREPLFHDS
jgi:hypothetical protein